MKCLFIVFFILISTSPYSQDFLVPQEYRYSLAELDSIEKIADGASNQHERSVNFYKLGLGYRANNNNILASKYLILSMKASGMDQKSIDRRAICYMTLAYLYAEAGKNNLRDSCLVRIRKLSDLISTDSIFIDAQMYISGHYASRNMLDSANFFLDRILVDNGNKGNHITLLHAFLSKSAYSIMDNELDTAKFYAQKVIGYPKGEHDDPYLIKKLNLMAYRRIASVFMMEGDYEESCTQLDTAYSLATKINDTLNLYRICNDLSKGYEKLQKLDSALIYQKRSFFFYSSYVNADYLSSLTEARLTSNFEHKKRLDSIHNNQILREKNLMLRHDEKQLNSAKIMITAILVLLFILAILLFRIKKSRRIILSQKLMAEQSLRDKELLLNEVHHRVKNNLQIISSLLNLQSKNTENQQIKDILIDNQHRIQSMGLIHHQLYTSDKVVELDFKSYVEKLVADIAGSFNSDSRDLDVQVQISPVKLNMDIAMLLGLVLNELITNSLKHGFTDNNQVNIDIKLIENTQDECILKVQDRGIGFPDNFHKLKQKSIGIRLIVGFVWQMRGEVEFKNSNGALIEIKFINGPLGKKS